MEKDLFLVIDMQRAYGKGGPWYCPNIEKATSNILKVIEEGKDKIDIAFTKFIASDKPKGIWQNYNQINQDVNEDANANLMIEDFEKYEGVYPFFEKSTYSSTMNKEVLDACKKAKRVVVSGVVAECCVLSTVMALIDEGIYVVYLKDAIAGVNDECEKAVELILDGLSYVHLSIMTSSEYLKEINQD